MPVAIMCVCVFSTQSACKDTAIFCVMQIILEENAIFPIFVTHFEFAKIATLSHAGMQGVSCRVLYGVLRTHSTFRVADSL